MGLRESWNELGTGGKVAVGLAVGGVLLIVALVVLVVLAAVLASFVLGLGDQPSQATPAASFSFDYEESASQATIVHDGGDSIQSAQLTVVVEDRRVGWADGGGEIGGDGRVVAGDSITVDVQPGDDVRVVYQGEEETSTLAVETIPE